MNKSILFYSIVLLFTLSDCSTRWPNHDISTLKLLQLVHRHGDRAPIEFEPNDPYRHSDYWEEGLGDLSTKGKYRLYKTGEFIRNEYNDYLGDKYSPREVYARSSVTDRCVESVSCLLSGAYPPKQHDWQWNNGSDAQLGKNWQPIPIQTFMPHINDLVCNQDKYCPIVDKEKAKIYSQKAIKEFLEKNSQLYKNLTKVVGKTIRTIGDAATLCETLKIEMDHNYIWNKTWTKEEEKTIINELWASRQMQYRYDWDSPIIKRLRGGGLVRELNNNFQKVVNKQNNKKLYVYSTHDSTVGALMSALDIDNAQQPPFGATVLFELHQKKNSAHNEGYFVRVFYKNETQPNTENPHSLHWRDCGNQFDCPFNQYVNSTKHLLYTDFDKECNEKH